MYAKANIQIDHMYIYKNAKRNSIFVERARNYEINQKEKNMPNWIL